MRLASLLTAAAAAAGATAQPWTNFTQTQYWYTEQTLDHFDLTDNRTFSQRYWLVEDFWAPAGNGPIILYLCGEYTCPGVMPTRLFPLELAYQQGALVLVVEERGFGQSVPIDLQTENLRYINSRQAMEDLAQVLVWLQQQLNDQYSLPASFYRPTMVIGGSWPGAMSAFFRTKYPHLVIGSLASSAVVNAFVEFPQFDQQVAASAGPDCAAALRNVTSSVVSQLPGIKAAFQAQQLSDSDFLFFLADSGAEGIQYGYRAQLCEPMTSDFLAGRDPVPAYINYTLTVWGQGMGNDASEYDSNILSNPAQGGDGRAWWWMVCTELGWFQVAPAQGSIRSPLLTVQWHQAFCNKLFGLPMDALPDTEATNRYYGGQGIAGSNIYFSNGVEDPWKWASIQTGLSPSEQANVINCTYCAHCVDLYTPSPSDAPALVQERETVKALVAQWFTDAGSEGQ